MHACIHTYIHSYIHACMHAYISLLIYIHIYICMHIYIHIYDSPSPELKTVTVFLTASRLKLMPNPLCGPCGEKWEVEGGGLCRVCRTLDRLAGLVRGVYTPASSQGPLLGILRETIAQVQDLGELCRGVVPVPVRTPPPAGEGAGAPKGGVPPPPPPAEDPKTGLTNCPKAAPATPPRELPPKPKGERSSSRQEGANLSSAPSTAASSRPKEEHKKRRKSSSSSRRARKAKRRSLISPNGKLDRFFVYCINLVLLCSENKVRSLYIYTNIYIHIYVYIHKHIHIYIHTHITLHHITLHHITLHYIPLHYITLHYIHKYIYIYIHIHTYI